MKRIIFQEEAFEYFLQFLFSKYRHYRACGASTDEAQVRAEKDARIKMLSMVGVRTMQAMPKKLNEKQELSNNEVA